MAGSKRQRASRIRLNVAHILNSPYCLPGPGHDRPRVSWKMEHVRVDGRANEKGVTTAVIRQALKGLFPGSFIHKTPGLSRDCLYFSFKTEIHSNFPKSFSWKATSRDLNLGLPDCTACAFRCHLLLPGAGARRYGDVCS